MESVVSHSEEQIPYATSDFKQQRMPACKPFLTPLFAAVVFVIFALISLSLGLVYYLYAEDMHEVVIDYSDWEKGIVTKEIEIPEDLNGNIYLYYELTNFYQNNFVYSSSMSWDQWTGKSLSKADISKCSPVKTKDGKPYAPCGAVSLSVFNDTFSFDSNFPAIKEKDITPSNYKKLFKPLGNTWNDTSSILTLDEELFPGNQNNDHFINWALVAAFPTFRKMWGKIEGDHIAKGKYKVTINNQYPSDGYGGKKRIVLAEVNWMGGRNPFIGYFFLTIFGFSVVAAIVFVVIHYTNALPLYKALVIEQSNKNIALLS